MGHQDGEIQPPLTTCLVLGSAECLQEDIGAYAGPINGVIAVNAAGIIWPGRLDAWVTGHPEDMTRKGWLASREAKGYPDAPLWTHELKT